MCGQSPLYVPTTINAVVRNIDAVDVSATNVSCTNFTLNGEPFSNVFQNVSSTSTNNTVFSGTVSATNLTATSALTAATVNAGSVSATGGSITGGSLTVTGSVQAANEVGGETLRGVVSTATQNSITKIGTQTSFACSGSIVQSGGSTTLLGTTVSSLSSSGNISAAGNITQSTTGSTASLKTVTVDSLTTAGNITQTGTGATTLRSLTNQGTLTQTGAATFATNITQTAGTATVQDLVVNGSMTVPAVLLTLPSPISGSITTGAATFKTPNFTETDSVIIQWANVGCSGYFTPYLRFGYNTTLYTTGYQGYTFYDGDGSVSTNLVSLNAFYTGLGNNEQMTGQITLKRFGTRWTYEGFSNSNNTPRGWRIQGNFAAGPINNVTFGVTSGTLNVTTATYYIQPRGYL